MEDREMPRMHKYGESKTTRIMMATVPHVTAWAGHTKYQAAWFLLNRVYIRYYKWVLHYGICQQFIHTFQISSLCLMSLPYCLSFTDFWIWIALGDVDLCLSVMLVRKVNAIEEEVHELHDYITNVINPHTWLMARQWCHFLLASHRR